MKYNNFCYIYVYWNKFESSNLLFANYYCFSLFFFNSIIYSMGISIVKSLQEKRSILLILFRVMRLDIRQVMR